MKKQIMIALVGLAAMFGSANAAELIHTNNYGTSTTSVQVNSVTTGSITDSTIKYATDRSNYAGPTGKGCSSSACSGQSNVDNSVVSASLSYQVSKTDLNEKTTGSAVTTSTFCDTSISGGILTATQGANSSKSVSDLTTQRNNMTTVSGYDVAVDTSTNSGNGYPGKGKGNDVSVSLGNGSSFNTYGDFTVKAGATSLGDIKVTDFDPVAGTENGIGLSYTEYNQKTVDTSVVKQSSDSYSNSTYSSLK